MATVNLDRQGYFKNIVGAQTPGPSITFSYDTRDRSSVKCPVSGIYVGNEAVVNISYNKGAISGVFPGKAANKVTVNIG